MTRDDPKPDHTDDARGRDVGSGYPEEQPPGAQPGTPNRQGTDERDGDAPQTDGGRDSDPQSATGNPDAAG